MECVQTVMLRSLLLEALDKVLEYGSSAVITEYAATRLQRLCVQRSLGDREQGVHPSGAATAPRIVAISFVDAREQVTLEAAHTCLRG